MNADLKDAFSRIKPICDVLMVCPSPESIGAFVGRVTDLKKEVVQELQQYLLFPLITHLKSAETHDKQELQRRLVDAMVMVLEKVTVNSFEMCMKMEAGLLQIVFEHNRPGMIADISEELKLSVMKCLTVLLLNLDPKQREAMLMHIPLLAKAVYVSVHIAKREKLRTLRLAAINCVTAHTATHPQLTNDYHISSQSLEIAVVEMVSLILPGVLGALQDVATSCDNPGHLLVVSAIDAMHRILCLAMNDKYFKLKAELTAADFAKMIKEKEKKEVSNKEPVDTKKVQSRTSEWFTVAGDKLLLVTKSMVSLRTHEHFKVRKELAIYCSRLMFECNMTLKTSVPLTLDTLICLAKDEYPEVSEYCTNAINTYFANSSGDRKTETLEALCDNFFATLTSLPRVMNNIDSGRKLSTLNLVHGYIEVLSTMSRPQRLTCALSVMENVECLCTALVHTAATHPGLTLLTQHAIRNMNSPPPTNSPWCKLRHLDNEACERRFQDICRLLGEAECAELVVDRLLELFNQTRDAEVVYVMNWMCTAPNSSENLIKRILNTYIEEDVWYLPLEVYNIEPPISEQDTLDVTVYNPRSWHKDVVPDLYEGAVETRYTDISYAKPRVRSHTNHNACVTISDAQRNMLLSCLLTEGIGVMANRLGDNYQPYLLKTLCLVLERVGSRYEMLHLSGLKAIHSIAKACGHESVRDLVKCNADYFTNQVTVRLKKAWNCQSALQILSVVMEYSDTNILNYLYGIVQDVLVQSCDKFYEKDLHAYLQVFITFLECIRKWYMIAQRVPDVSDDDEAIDILAETREYIQHNEEAERLLTNAEFEEETGKSVEEMYREDLKKREEEELDYDETVMDDKPPPPQYVAVTATILKRCLNYVVTSQKENCMLSLQVLNTGFPILRGYDDDLLPLIHQTWAPLVNKFEVEPAIVRRAFDLLVTMAELSKDFIRNRAIKEVLPYIYKFLHKSSKESYLKDIGSCYRTSQTYSLQVTVLAGLARLVTHLQLEDEHLDEAMNSVDAYLSNRQPKPLQLSAVEFFRRILDYDYGVAWYHLRELCHNDQVLLPPSIEYIQLESVVGTPFLATDAEYEINIKSIFNYMVS